MSARPAAGQVAAPAPGRRPGGRRVLRLVAPIAVALLLLVGTAVAYQVQQPDQGDPAYLSPTSAAATGAGRLAAMVTGRGTTIQRVTSGSQALRVAAGQGTGAAVLFVPAPSLIHPYYLRMIKLLPAGVRVVLVAPTGGALSLGLVPAAVAGTSLAARPARPDCSYAPAARAGTAAVFRTRYRAEQPLVDCYGGALTAVRRGAATITMVGSDEPFRNDRIGEYHNAALATELLTGAPLVIWLDLHRPEPMPGYIDGPAGPADEPAAPASLGPGGSPDPEFPIPDTEQPDDPGGGTRKHASGDGGGGNPLWRVLPPWAPAFAMLLALVAVLVALAMGRRLGAPVTEPLPIVVRGTETVTGRGRLYQRARARGPAAATLRAAAAERIAHLLDVPRDADPHAVAAAVAAHTGRPAEAVARLLAGGAPADDAELVGLAVDLEALVAAAAGPAVAGEDRHKDASVRGVADEPEGESR